MATNHLVYEQAAKFALGQVMEGATCNFFAHGHSRSAKIHKIIGFEYDNDEYLGLCLPALCDLSQAVSAHKEEHEEEALGVAARLCEVRGLSAFDSFNNGTKCHVRQGPDGQMHLRGETEILEDGNGRVRPMVAKPFWSLDELQQAVLASI